eukprot:scaffold688127_cov67-Attheya_sp.AAC.1
MASAFLIGAGGVGKTTLIEEYVRKTGTKAFVIKEQARNYMKDKNIVQNDLDNDEVFWDLQIGIAQLQLKRELELEGQQFISDRSVVDAIAYAATRMPHRFPLLSKPNKSQKRKPDDLARELLAPLLKGLGSSWSQTM